MKKWISNKQLVDSAINELKFANMEIEYLLSVIYEIDAISDDILVKSVIKNSIDRHYLDKSIHSRSLFFNK